MVPHSSVQTPRAARNCSAFWDAIGTPRRSRERRIGGSFEKQCPYLNALYALTSNFPIHARPLMDRSASDNDVQHQQAANALMLCVKNFEADQMELLLKVAKAVNAPKSTFNDADVEFERNK